MSQAYPTQLKEWEAFAFLFSENWIILQANVPPKHNYFFLILSSIRSVDISLYTTTWCQFCIKLPNVTLVLKRQPLAV